MSTSAWVAGKPLWQDTAQYKFTFSELNSVHSPWGHPMRVVYIPYHQIDARVKTAAKTYVRITRLCASRNVAEDKR